MAMNEPVQPVPVTVANKRSGVETFVNLAVGMLAAITVVVFFGAIYSSVTGWNAPWFPIETRPQAQPTAQMQVTSAPLPTNPPVYATPLSPARTDPLPVIQAPVEPGIVPIATAAPPVAPASGEHPAVVPVIQSSENLPSALGLRDDNVPAEGVEPICYGGMWYRPTDWIDFDQDGKADKPSPLIKADVSCSGKGGD